MFKVEHINKSYEGLQVLTNLSLEFPEGKITVILGPSGCGKTTLLNVLAGITKADSGKRLGPEQVSYMFQEPRLLPCLTVEDNIGLILQDKINPAQIRENVRFYLKAAGVLEYADYYPRELSGGLKQRVALARAFCYQAPLLLMDEPFKSLDLKVRYHLIDDFIAMWRKHPRTVVAVTHDLQEAVLLGDVLILLSDKPARVRKRLEINYPQEGRKQAPEIAALEKKLLKLLLE